MASSSKRPRAFDMEAYVRAGLQLIPLHRWDAVDPKGRPRGKTPADGKWQARDYDNGRVLAQVQDAGVNAGVRLPADVMVLDVDPRNFPAGKDSLAELVAHCRLDLSVCPHTVTGSGGDHFWFRKPADVTLLDSLEDYQGVEFKSFGRQVVAAGSIHPSGEHYEWDDLAPPLSEMPPMPESLLRLCRRPTRAHGEAAGFGELTAEMLAETLEQLDPEDFRDHDTWRDLMMACHHATAGDGRQEFIEWSTRDPQYRDDGWIIGRRWDSLHADSGRGGRPVTVKYLHKVVQEAGGEVARSAPEDDFEEWEPEDDGGQGVDHERLTAPPPKPEGKEGVMEELNAKHAVVFEGGKFRIFTEEMDPVLSRPFFQRSSKEDFENLYCNQLVEMGDKMATKSQVWLRSMNRRQYKGVIFDPARDHPGWLNLWKGWSVQPASGDWSLLKQLILEVLVDGVREHYEYVMRWMAYMVQQPSNMAEVAICFRGEKGTGKGTLGRALAELAGSHGLHISSPEHLVGRFNSHLQNCLFLFADEAFWAGDKAGEAKLKQLCTEPTIAFEGKGRDAVMGKNYVHIMMAANGDWVVPAGLDGERRFAVFEVNRSRKGDKAFFTALNRQMNGGGRAAMLHELLTMDLEDWAPRDNVPATKALLQQKEMTMTDVERWWYGKLNDGFLPNMRSEWRDGPITLIKEQLRADYVDYAKEQRAYKPADEIEFGRRLNKLVTLKNTQTKPLDTDYGLKVDSKGRASAYVIPSLGECRAAFELKMGGKVDWPRDD